MYTLIFSVCSTFLMASETVYLGRAVQDGTTRGKLLSISGVLTMLFSAAVSIMLPSLMATLGTQPGGWTKISLILGIPMMLMGIIRFVTIKEKRTIDTETKEEKISIKKGISILKQNKYIFILSLIILGVLKSNMIRIHNGMMKSSYGLAFPNFVSVRSIANPTNKSVIPSKSFETNKMTPTTPEPKPKTSVE